MSIQSPVRKSRGRTDWVISIFLQKLTSQPEPGNFEPHKWLNLSTQDDFETVLWDRQNNADHDKDVPGIYSAPRQKTSNIKATFKLYSLKSSVELAQLNDSQIFFSQKHLKGVVKWRCKLQKYSLLLHWSIWVGKGSQCKEA